MVWVVSLFRHIVATAILKASGGDFKTAALVLYDRVATVEKHYAFLTANEGGERMSESWLTLSIACNSAI